MPSFNIGDLGLGSEPTDRVINILIQLGLDEASLQKVKDGTLSVDAAVKKLEKGTGESGEAIAGNVGKIASSFTTLFQAGRLLTSIGRAETIFGRLFKDEDLRRMGEITRGIGLLTISIGRLKNILAALPQIAAGGGIGAAAVAGGAGILGGLLGIALYDKIVGPRQETYNYQTGQMEAQTAGHMFAQVAAVASYNLTMIAGDADKANTAFLDTAKMYGLIADEAAIANQKLMAVNSQYKYAVENMAGLAPQLSKEGFTDTSYEALKAEESKYKEILRQLESGEMLEGPTMFLAKAQTRLKLIEQALGLVEKEMAGTPEVQAFIDYQKELTKSQRKYGDEQVKIQDETGKRINDSTIKWDRETAKAYDDFLKANRDAAIKLSRDIAQVQRQAAANELRIEQDYYDRRVQQAADFGIEMQRMEQDHAIEMQRGSKEHAITLRKLAEQLDAGGIEDENQRYRLEQKQKEEQYQLEVARKNEDYARKVAYDQQNFERERAQRDQEQAMRIAELKLAFAEESTSRKSDFTAKNKERNDQYDLEIADLQKNGVDKLTELDKQHGDELSDINQSWTDRRQQLGLWLAGERDQFYTYMQARQNDLQMWVNTHLSIPGVTGAPVTIPFAPVQQPFFAHQLGGYQSESGWAYLHGNEFVLSADTARKAEQIVGGPLTQQSILNAGPQIHITQSFSGQESEPATYKRLMYEVIADVFTRAHQQVGAG